MVSGDLVSSPARIIAVPLSTINDNGYQQTARAGGGGEGRRGGV